MARLEDINPTTRQRLIDLDCPRFDEQPFVAGPPLNRRKVAIVSSAALIRRGELPFLPGAADFRTVPNDRPAGDILMSHISVNFDRHGFARDPNIALPRERLAELVAEGAIGSVADTHFTVMGSTDPREMQASADAIAAGLKAQGVDAALLLPV
jgi:D-proline reductase (dithiol) PrdB